VEKDLAAPPSLRMTYPARYMYRVRYTAPMRACRMTELADWPKEAPRRACRSARVVL